MNTVRGLPRAVKYGAGIAAALAAVLGGVTLPNIGHAQPVRHEIVVRVDGSKVATCSRAVSSSTATVTTYSFSACSQQASVTSFSAPSLGFFPFGADCNTNHFVIFFYGGTGHMHGHTTVGISITCNATPQQFTATMAIYAKVKAGQEGKWIRASRYVTLDLADLPSPGNTERYHVHGICWKNARERMVLTFEGVSSDGAPDHGTYFYPNRLGHRTRACDKGD